MTDDETTPTDGDLARTGSQVTQLIAAVGPPLTVATGLLFYFGWVRTSVEATTLGVDYSVFGYTTQDYVLRSVSSLFLPLVCAATVGIAVLLLHGWLVRGVRTGPASRRFGLARGLGLVLLPSCVVLPVLTLAVELARPEFGGLLLPLGVAIGLLLTAYGVLLRRRTAADAHLRETPAERRHSRRVRVLLGIVVTATLFWWVGDFAGVVGRGLAERVVANIQQMPGVVIYSQQNLQLTAAGVRVTPLDPGQSGYAYRYDGLRLLDRSNGHLFLLPDGWTMQAGTMVVIADNDQVRIEYTHGSTRMG